MIRAFAQARDDGRFVIDHEEVTGTFGDTSRTIHAVAIYEVIDGLIRRVWFLDRE